MKHTRIFAVVTLAFLLATVMARAEGVVLQLDQVKQRYPWNGLVDIDYTISGDDAATLGLDDNLEIRMIDKSVSPAVTNRALVFLQAPLPVTAGKHRVTWDANKDGVTNRVEQAEFDIQIVHYAEAYAVIDVSGGASATTYPVDFLNGAPSEGVTANVYKGDKIILRLVRPGSYVAGSPEDENGRTPAYEVQHNVAISQPFYLGVFEITQKQYFNVTGADPSAYKGDYRPVEKVSYDTIRGVCNEQTHQYAWPWTNEVASTSFMGLLRNKCRARDGNGNYTVPVDGFDLPTEFQWEYACRAGTTKAVSTTNEFNNKKANEIQAQLSLASRWDGNQADGLGGYSQYHTIVGSYLPNAWGFYDMHGNVQEWCVETFGTDPAALRQYVDPQGPAVVGWRSIRGGDFRYQGGGYTHCRSASRSNGQSNFPFDYVGFRLFLPLP